LSDRIDISGDGIFRNEIEERVYNKLKQLVGTDLAEYFKDACRIMSSHPQFATTTHLVGHLLRELDNRFLGVLEHISGDQIDESRKDDKHKARREIVLRFLGIKNDDKVAVFWLQLQLHADAHSKHLSYRRVDESFRKQWDEIVRLYDNLLNNFEEKYLAAHQIVEQLTEIKYPKPADFEQLVDKVPNNRIALKHFFGNANAKWLKLSKFKEHFFKHPPEVVNGYYTDWAESGYLVRHSGTVPIAILEVTLQIPDTTNPIIVGDICKIAVNLPIEECLALIPRVLSQLKGVRAIYAEDALKLIEMLVINKHETTALEIVSILFAPVEDEVTSWRYKKVSARLEQWEYEESLQTVVLLFVKTKKLDLVRLLIDLLDAALDIAYPVDEYSSDNSYWREKIPQANYEENQSIEDSLVSALYLAAIKLIEMGVPVDEILQFFKTAKREIHQRIVLLILAAFEQSTTADAVAPYIVNQTNFSNWTVEYFSALARYFGLLPISEQSRILQWIDEIAADDPNEKDEFIHYRQAQALSYIEEELSLDWKKRYQILKEEFEAISKIESVFSSVTVSYRTTSPFSLDELKNKPVGEVITILRELQPTNEFMSPSLRGLKRTITSLVQEIPNEYALFAFDFKQLQPTYVFSYIEGLREAIKDGKKFDWNAVIELCFWVTQRSLVLSENPSFSDEFDSTWSWTRGEIAILLEVGFMKDAIPFSLREDAWNILEVLLEDPDPNLERDQSYVEIAQNSGFTSSLNTNRGKAFHALLQYSLWCKRNLLALSETERNPVLVDFNSMPEVRAILDAHLLTDRSPIIRSVYGRYFPWLYYLDTTWGTANTQNIFPLASETQPLFQAAWDSYLQNGSVCTDLYPVLKEQYAQSVNLLKQVQSVSPHRNPNIRLARHLMMLYWIGVVKFEEEIMTQFFNIASDDLRAAAIHFIGTCLTELDHNQSERVRKLWRFRLEQAQKNPAMHQKEISAFGSWLYPVATIDVLWQLENVAAVLQISPTLSYTHRVFEWLADRVSEWHDAAEKTDQILLLVAKSLNILMSTAGQERISPVDKLRAGIQTIIQSGNAEAKEIMRSMINKLAAKGNMQFKDLLDSPIN